MFELAGELLEGVGGWVGGWLSCCSSIGRMVEENEAVGKSYCGWVGGWVYLLYVLFETAEEERPHDGVETLDESITHCSGAWEWVGGLGESMHERVIDGWVGGWVVKYLRPWS